jgi:hypothetical protein
MEHSLVESIAGSGDRLLCDWNGMHDSGHPPQFGKRPSALVFPKITRRLHAVVR